MRYRKGLTNPCRFCGRPTTGTLCGDHMTQAASYRRERVLTFEERVAAMVLKLAVCRDRDFATREYTDFYEAHLAQARPVLKAVRGDVQ